MPAHRLGTKKLKRKNLIHVHQILQVCTRCPNDFRHKFGKRSQNVTNGIAVKISLQFDEYFSNFLHSNFYWYIRDFHYNLLSKAHSYHKNIIFFSDMATSSMANASPSTDGNVESSSTQQQSET